MFLLKIMFHLDHAFQKLIKDNTEDLDTAMLMYNLLEYSQNYSMTSGKLQNYYRNKVDDVNIKEKLQEIHQKEIKEMQMDHQFQL